MGFGLMALGFVFLFNPAVCIYDILPDFIGYILIFRGLLKTEIAFSSTEKMRRMFMNLTWIGVIKFIASIILYFGVKGAADDDASALVFTFVFFVAEIVFLVPTMVRLLTQMSDVGLRCGVPNSLKVKGLRIYTGIFFTLRAFLPVIPEFFTLSSYEVNVMKDYFRMVRRNVLTIGFALVGFILGIIWLVLILRYFNRMKKSKIFAVTFEEKYRMEFAANPNVLVKRALFAAFSVFSVALGFNIDFYAATNDRSVYYESANIVTSAITDWGMVNLIPDVLCAIVLIASLIAMAKHNKFVGALTVSAAGYFIVTVFSYVSELIFNSKFVMDDVGYRKQADVLYADVCVSNCVKDIVFIVFLLFITLNLCNAINNHTGQAVVNIDMNAHSIRLKRLHGELRRRLWVAFAFGCVSAVVSLISVINMPYVRQLWMLDIAFTAIHWAITATAMGAVKKELLARYED